MYVKEYFMMFLATLVSILLVTLVPITYSVFVFILLVIALFVSYMYLHNNMIVAFLLFLLTYYMIQAFTRWLVS